MLTLITPDTLVIRLSTCINKKMHPIKSPQDILRALPPSPEKPHWLFLFVILEMISGYFLKQVKCVFITDGFIKDYFQRTLTVSERNTYKDMELQALQGGWEFGLRFLNHIRWAMAKFDFQYLLRIDDDYFLCLKRLLEEISLRPKDNLVWGHFHCEVGITWIDESFLLFSKNIIQQFLAQNESTMLCHPHADQQIGIWLQDIKIKQYFHDTRLYHHPPASYAPQFQNATNFVVHIWDYMEHTQIRCGRLAKMQTIALKTCTQYLHFQVFAKPRRLIIERYIPHTILNLNLAKTIHRGTWEIKCFLVVNITS